jgi:hypothetical protein
MLNLSATFPLQVSHQILGLPVLVDLTWYGQTMTSENGGIVPSRSAYRNLPASDDAIIL